MIPIITIITSIAMVNPLLWSKNMTMTIPDYTHGYGSSHQCVLYHHIIPFIAVILPMISWGVIIRPKLRPLVPHSPAWTPGTSAPRPRAGPVGRGDGTSIQRPASAVECRRCTTRRTYGFFDAKIDRKSSRSLWETWGKLWEIDGNRWKSMEIWGTGRNGEARWGLKPRA